MNAVYISKERGLEIRSLPKPALCHGRDVLIRITSAAICSSDIEIASGKHPFAGTNMILGHEFGGVVEAVGPEVEDLTVGTKVCVDPLTACGTCPSCKKGRPNICLNLKTMGVHRDGGFTEYVCVPREQVYAFANQGISEELLALAEPYSIGMQMNYRAQTTGGDKVVVIGAGPIGLCTMQAAKMRGAAVLITDVIEERLVRAAQMGADVTVNVSREKFETAVMDFTENLGADVILNTAGVPGSMEEAIAAAAYGGRIVTVGLSKVPSGIRQADLVKKELNICGSRLSTRQFASVVEGIDQGYLTPEKLVTHRFPLDKISAALDCIQKDPGAVCKVLLTF